jgi:hypothetical protein
LCIGGLGELESWGLSSFCNNSDHTDRGTIRYSVDLRV